MGICVSLSRHDPRVSVLTAATCSNWHDLAGSSGFISPVLILLGCMTLVYRLQDACILGGAELAYGYPTAAHFEESTTLSPQLATDSLQTGIGASPPILPESNAATTGSCVRTSPDAVLMLPPDDAACWTATKGTDACVCRMISDDCDSSTLDGKTLLCAECSVGSEGTETFVVLCVDSRVTDGVSSCGERLLMTADDFETPAMTGDVCDEACC